MAKPKYDKNELLENVITVLCESVYLIEEFSKTSRNRELKQTADLVIHGENGLVEVCEAVERMRHTRFGFV